MLVGVWELRRAWEEDNWWQGSGTGDVIFGGQKGTSSKIIKVCGEVF